MLQCRGSAHQTVRSTDRHVLNNAEICKYAQCVSTPKVLSYDEARSAVIGILFAR
jgi:hypothetical protein